LLTGPYYQLDDQLLLNYREISIGESAAVRLTTGFAPQKVHLEHHALLPETGDREAQPMNSLFSNPVVSALVVWWMPWPKGAPTASEFIQGEGGTPPAEFERDKQALLLVIHRFAHHPENELFRSNPVFGRLSRRAWGRLMWRHIDHHLRQFGL